MANPQLLSQQEIVTVISIIMYPILSRFTFVLLLVDLEHAMLKFSIISFFRICQKRCGPISFSFLKISSLLALFSCFSNNSINL